MNFWEIFWGLVVLFSIISFTYMSVKILYSGFPELKEMFTALNEKANGKNNSIR